MEIIIGVAMITFAIGGGIGLALGLSLGLYEIRYKEKILKKKRNKQYIVIERAEGYKYFYDYKIFDNYEDAYNYNKEADEMEQIKYAEIAEYNFIEAFESEEKEE